MFRSRLFAAALLISPAAFAAKPAAPPVPVAAALKQLQFDVEPVAGATSYELWFLPNGAASWVKYMDTIAADPLFKVTVSGHLLDWFNARYRVRACNAEGCSTTANIAVTSLMKDSVGYFKPRAARVSPYSYGQSPALSADGKTLAVLTGETIGPNVKSAAVYVYEKADSGWRRVARLLPSPVYPGTVDVNSGQVTHPRQIAVSGDGTTIVFGVPTEPGPGAGSNRFRAGAVYVFHKSGTTWTLEQKIGPPAVGADELGTIVDIDTQAQTLAVWRGNGWRLNGGEPYVQIYRRGAAGWAPSGQIRPAVGITHFDMSGDGKVAVLYNADRTVDVYSGAGFVDKQTLTRMQVRSTRIGTVAINHDGSVIALETMGEKPPAGANWQQHIMAFRRGSSGWVPEPAFTYAARQPTPQLGISDKFGSALAVSDDGRFIAVGDPENLYEGTGALHPPITRGMVASGAFFVFERKSASWALRSLIKPNVAKPVNTRFAESLAFGDDNRVLAVSEIREYSGARDIDGDQEDTSGGETGALWLY